MAKPEDGNIVVVNYTGKLKDGTIFDSTNGEDRDAFEFKLGENKVIPKFEETVKEMEKGEEKTVEIKSEDAYGEEKDDLIFEMPKSKLPDDLEPQKERTLQMQDNKGNPFYATIKDIKDETLVLDANHPLAGKDLTFEIELVDIKKD
ncbi:MAG: peptidylprolyl isomerase [Candidatus Mcinerneyibacterium aminivorans]|uniref:Peptidyl-prolyl cis-trans isomerase n=1 Tax=Candidatus Mcinerneyibacterium aminivorans TaxID=2703815 RepID=A0A5D0MGM0_9BACT|nr:MAG: peptidylprolyl isomerase [Candidatus Mcinerneyibacterium aminivorans]